MPERYSVFAGVASVLLFFANMAWGQASAGLGNGLSAAAIGRGGATVTAVAAPLDAMEGNPAGLAGVTAPTLEASVLGMVAGGSFENSANANARLSGVAGAMPYGAFAMPLGRCKWVISGAVTPELLMRANWHYNDAPGTAGVTYGNLRQETQIIAMRSSVGVARSLGTRWSAGGTVGLVYNQNDLNAPYIFQQQAALKGLKVLLALTTRGVGWNGSAGVQWRPTMHLQTGLAWKSATSLHTHGDADGSASALFTALGLAVDPVFHYRAAVENHLPQALDAGVTWQTRHHILLSAQGDVTLWERAFRELPITVSGGTNTTINSVVGSNTFADAVPLHWRNQVGLHVGAEMPVREKVTVRAGYAYATNPVPSATLTPLTAAMMQHSVATGVGWARGRWRYDAAYQAQLPAAATVGTSGLQAGEYSHSRVQVWTQSVTGSARVTF